MKVTRVEAIALAAPFEKVFGGLDKVPAHILRPAANQVTHPRLGQASTIVRIETDEGIVGIGEALGLPTPEITATIVGKHLKRLLLGQDPRDTTVLWESLHGSLRTHRLGFAVNAIAAVDLALWDIKGKALDLPASRCWAASFAIGSRSTPARCRSWRPPRSRLARQARSSSRAFGRSS
jgi:L-alanine-DL-glutamate epimerase-like enolase superfamily enzyme